MEIEAHNPRNLSLKEKEEKSNSQALHLNYTINNYEIEEKLVLFPLEEIHLLLEKSFRPSVP